VDSQLGRRDHRRRALRQTGKDRGIGGPLLGPSAYFMKSPPVQYRDEEAREMVETFAAGK
jgi:myo-inositol-1-phosphate synthase